MLCEVSASVVPEIQEDSNQLWERHIVGLNQIELTAEFSFSPSSRQSFVLQAQLTSH